MAARPRFSPTEEERETIREIARFLDGIPLALELAGARLGVLSVQEVRARLHRCLDLLVSNRRGIDPRHRTLRAALDASYELLTPAEQRALQIVSVFSGGFDLVAGERVLEASTEEAASLVDGLCQKSWLTRRETPEGGLRFDIYSALRAYGRDVLEAHGSPDSVQRRHAEHYVIWAEEQDDRSTLEKERENLLQVVTAPGLDHFLRARALLSLEELLLASETAATHLQYLDALLEQSSALEPVLAGRLHLARARARDRSGDTKGAVRDCACAVRIGMRAGHAILRFEAATFGVTLAYMHGALARAVARGRTILGKAADVELPARSRAVLLMEVGVALHMAGERAEAEARYEDALRIAREAGSVDAIGRVLACLGFLHQDLGKLDRARDAYEEALEVHIRLRNHDVEGIVRGYLGNLDRRQGHLERAEAHYTRALDLLRRVGDRQFEAVVLMDHGFLLLDQGCADAAEDRLKAAIDTFERTDGQHCHALTTSALAVVESARGDFEQAHACMEAAKRHMPAEDPRRSVLRLHEEVIALAEEGEARVPGARVVLEETDAAVRTCDYTKLASRLLERSIARFDRPEGSYLLERTGAYFEAPGEDRVMLERREALRRVLGLLISRRFEAPGEAVTPAALWETGWPGEKMLESAAKNRLRVAVATLRKLGLEGLLLTRDGGYLLDPERPALRVES